MNFQDGLYSYNVSSETRRKCNVLDNLFVQHKFKPKEICNSLVKPYYEYYTGLAESSVFLYLSLSFQKKFKVCAIVILYDLWLVKVI